jgi:hypothetical protein
MLRAGDIVVGQIMWVVIVGLEPAQVTAISSH